MKLDRFIKIYSGIFVLLQVISIFYPSHFNWGIHHLAFHEKFFGILAIVLAFSLFSNSFRGKILSFLSNILKRINKSKLKLLPFLIVVILFTLISGIFPADTHLLGDGALLLREIANVWITEEIPPAFGHQFLIGITMNMLKYFFEIHSLQKAELLYRYFDYTIGIILIGLIFVLMKNLKLKPVEKFLYGSLILFSPAMQMFIGYVENYALLFLSVSALIITGWLSLEKNLNFIIPVFIFLIAIGVHIGSIIFLPGILYLIFKKLRRNKKALHITTGLTSLFVIIILVFLRNEFTNILNQALLESRWSLLPIFSTEYYFPYTIFSIYHIVDWLNANLLVIPFGVAIIIGAFLFLGKQINIKDPVFIYISLLSLFGLLFTFVTHFALGMARDWDFMASFFVPVIFLNIYLILKINKTELLNNTLVLIIGLMLIHSLSWIGLNADEHKATNRIILLDENKFLGRTAKLNYYETLGSYFYWKNDFIQAKKYFEKYFEIDSTNLRILGNMAAIYTKLNDRENNFRILKKAAEAQSPNPGIYINLGVEYSRQGDYEKALECYHKALSLDSTRPKAYANMASLYMNQHKYDLAKENYLKALKYGLNEPLIYRELGTAFYYLNDYHNSLKYFELYLQQKPDDERAKNIKDQLSSIMKYLEENKK